MAPRSIRPGYPSPRARLLCGGGTAKRRAGGQALTEFIVLSLVLVPIFLLLPLIGKYQDMAHQTQMASRYAAFDATINNGSTAPWKPEAQLADEVRRRFFSNPDAPVKTLDVAGDSDNYHNPLWVDPSGKYLIDKLSDIQVTYGSGYGATHAAGFSSAADGNPFALRSLLGLKAQHVYTANVSVRLAKLTAGVKALEPFDALNLSMVRHTSLIFDAWRAASPSHVQSQLFTNGLTPKTALVAMNAITSLAVYAQDGGEVSNPKLTDLDIWKDVVPNDRLKP